jgi:hypothetical protein
MSVDPLHRTPFSSRHRRWESIRRECRLHTHKRARARTLTHTLALEVPTSHGHVRLALCLLSLQPRPPVLGLPAPPVHGIKRAAVTKSLDAPRCRDTKQPGSKLQRCTLHTTFVRRSPCKATAEKAAPGEEQNEALTATAGPDSCIYRHIPGTISAAGSCASSGCSLKAGSV